MDVRILLIKHPYVFIVTRISNSTTSAPFTFVEAAKKISSNKNFIKNMHVL